MRAVIVGGGIAGPATAMALRAVGIDSLVVDANPADRGEVGSWFTVAANGVAALAAIDALEQVRGLGVPTDRNVMVSASGARSAPSRWDRRARTAPSRCRSTAPGWPRR